MPSKMEFDLVLGRTAAVAKQQTEASGSGHGDKVRVVFIAGWGRSGSTLLDLMIGSHPACTSVGEIKFLWQRGVIENRRCGCDTRFNQCRFWTDVVARTVGDDPQPGTINQMVRAADLTRTRHLAPMLVMRPRPESHRKLASYRRTLSDLYRSVTEVSGAPVVVDSSKFPSYLWVLSQIPDLDVRVVHLVRDPRAVAHSWNVAKPDTDGPDGQLMPRQHPAVTAAYWNAWNLAIRRLCHQAGTPRLTVRYEDLTTAPGDWMRRICSWLGLDPDLGPHIDIDRVAMDVNHTVSGNPGRHRQGTMAIVADERWRESMEPAHARLVWRLTAPVRSAFGYRA